MSLHSLPCSLLWHHQVCTDPRLLEASRHLFYHKPPRGRAAPEDTQQVEWTASLFSLASLKGQFSSGAIRKEAGPQEATSGQKFQ